MLHFLRSLFSRQASFQSDVDRVNARRRELAELRDGELNASGERAHDLLEIIAVTAVVAARVLGLVMFEVQVRGALALAQGKVAEMQTGEGKTLAAVPAIVWYAQERRGVHVMTVNDYLARRDARFD